MTSTEDPRIKLMEEQINRLIDAGNAIVIYLEDSGQLSGDVGPNVETWRKAVEDQRWCGGYESWDAEKKATEEYDKSVAAGEERYSRAYAEGLMDEMVRMQAGAEDPNRYWEWKAGEVRDTEHG